MPCLPRNPFALNFSRSSAARTPMPPHLNLQPLSYDHQQRQELQPVRLSQPSAPPLPAPPSLLDLPFDVLGLVVRFVSRVPDSISSLNDDSALQHPDAVSCVDADGYAQGLNLAMTCRKFNSLFHPSLAAITLPSIPLLDDRAVVSIAEHSRDATRRLIIRNCPLLTDRALAGIAANMSGLRTVDLSFLAGVTDAGVVALCSAVGWQLDKLLLRKCTGLTDVSLNAIAVCASLRTLDLSYIGPAITDAGTFALCRGCGPSLRIFSLSHNPSLSDNTFVAIGTFCGRLQQLCARSLPLVTDAGFLALCQGVGATACGLDVIDCRTLTKYAVVRAFSEYCRHIHHVDDPESRSLRSVLYFQTSIP
jgi:hypothetical protein